MDTPEEQSEPRWLTAEERQAWLTLSCVIVRLGPALDAQLHRDAGISYFEYMVMAALSEVPQRTLRMSELADLAGGSLSRLSQVVTRLEKKDWSAEPPTPPTAAPPSPSSPTMAGTRSSPPPPDTSPKSAGSCSTPSPKHKPTNSPTSPNESCESSTPTTGCSPAGTDPAPEEGLRRAALWTIGKQAPAPADSAVCPTSRCLVQATVLLSHRRSRPIAAGQ